MGETFQEKIRARFYQGFKNWNKGYAAWLEWCNILYEPDAMYNVYGRRLTLGEYKDECKKFFTAGKIELGELENVLVEGAWGAIRYTVYLENDRTNEKYEMKTMEFVKFKDNPDPIGARVIEGWAISDGQVKM